MPKSKIVNASGKGTINTKANVQIGFSRPELQKKHVKIQGARSTLKRERGVLNTLADALAPKYSVKGHYQDFWSCFLNPFFVNQLKWDHGTKYLPSLVDSSVYAKGLDLQSDIFPLKRLNKSVTPFGQPLKPIGTTTSLDWQGQDYQAGLEYSELYGRIAYDSTAAEYPGAYGTTSIPLRVSSITGGHSIDVAGGMQNVHVFWLNDKHTRRERQVKAHQVAEESYTKHVLVQQPEKKTFVYQDPNYYGVDLGLEGGEVDTSLQLHYKNPEYELHHDSMEVTYTNTANEACFIEFVEYQPTLGCKGPLEYYEDWLCQNQAEWTGLIGNVAQAAQQECPTEVMVQGSEGANMPWGASNAYTPPGGSSTVEPLYYELTGRILNATAADVNTSGFTTNTEYYMLPTISDLPGIYINGYYTGYKAWFSFHTGGTVGSTTFSANNMNRLLMTRDTAVTPAVGSPGDSNYVAAHYTHTDHNIYNGGVYEIRFTTTTRFRVLNGTSYLSNPFSTHLTFMYKADVHFTQNPNTILPMFKPGAAFGVESGCTVPRTAEVNLPLLTARNYLGGSGYKDVNADGNFRVELGTDADDSAVTGYESMKGLKPNHYSALTMIQGYYPSTENNDIGMTTNVSLKDLQDTLELVSVPLSERKTNTQSIGKTSVLGIDAAATVGTFCHRTLQNDGTFPSLEQSVAPSFRPVNMMSLSGMMHPTSDLKVRLNKYSDVITAEDTPDVGRFTRCETHDARMCLPNLANEWVKLWQEDLIDALQTRKNQSVTARPFAQDGDGNVNEFDVTSAAYEAEKDVARSKWLEQGQRPSGPRFNERYKKRKSTRVCLEPGSMISYQFFAQPGLEGESRLLNWDMPDRMSTSTYPNTPLGKEEAGVEPRSYFFDDRSRVLMVFVNGEPATVPVDGLQNQQTTSPCSLSMTMKTMERVRCLPKMFSNSKTFAHSIDKPTDRVAFKDGEFAEIGPDGLVLKYHQDGEDIASIKKRALRNRLATNAEHVDHSMQVTASGGNANNVYGTAPANETHLQRATRIVTDTIAHGAGMAAVAGIESVVNGAFQSMAGNN
jgi:hypothetical protein